MRTINFLCYCDGSECSYCFDERMAAQLTAEKTPTLPLTEREAQVLLLMAEGKHNHEIGQMLGITEHTAKFHVNAILIKTKTTTRLSAVIFALKTGLIIIQQLMPNVTYTPITATAMAILEENKQAMAEQMRNWKNNLRNDVMEAFDDIDNNTTRDSFEQNIRETLDVYFPT